MTMRARLIAWFREANLVDRVAFLAIVIGGGQLVFLPIAIALAPAGMKQQETFGLANAAALLVVGLGLWKRKEWARWCAVGYVLLMTGWYLYSAYRLGVHGEMPMLPHGAVRYPAGFRYFGIAFALGWCVVLVWLARRLLATDLKQLAPVRNPWGREA